MLPATARLCTGRDISLVMRLGARAGVAGVLNVYLLPRSPGVSDSRATVVVSKAVGGAVVRNRLRRRLRHSLSNQWAGLPAGVDMVVRGHRGAQQLSAADLALTLHSACRRASARVISVVGAS